MSEFAPYFWIITKSCTEFADDRRLIGLCGPGNGNENLMKNKLNEADFTLYDDDNNKCFEGKIYGEYDGFEPLDDWGKGGYGCTYITINGELI